MDGFRHPAFSLRAGLIPLESALIAAEKSTPPRAPRRDRDPNEALAAQLIERIRHPRPVTSPAMRIESPQPYAREAFLQMAGGDD
jgi:hypothetical protein